MKQNRYGLVILAVGSLTLVGAGGFVRYTFPLLLPAMRADLAANYGQMGLVATGNSIGYVISSFVGGILSTRYGARRIITASMFLAGVATFAMGFTPSVEMAVALQFLAGLAAGGCIIPAVGLAAAWFEPSKRGVATGIIIGGMPLGILISSRLLPLILGSMGTGAWRYGWMAMGVLVILMGVVSFLLIRDRPKETLGGAIGEGQGLAPGSPINWGLAFKNRAVLLLCSLNFSIGLAGGIFATFFVAYLVAQWGLTQSQASDAYGLVGLAGAASGLLWGYISDVIGRRLGLASDYYLFFVSLAILTFVSLPGAEYAASFLGGLTLYGGMTVTVALVGDAVGPRMVPAAFGLISLAFNTGQMISPALAGAITDATGSFTPPLIMATLFAFGAASVCFWLPSSRRGAS